MLMAVVHGSRGAVPVLDPRALLQGSLWRQLSDLIARQARTP
jgi:hypothetical protein